MSQNNYNVKVGDRIKVYPSTFEDQRINEELADIQKAQGYFTVSAVNRGEFNTYIRIEEDKTNTVSLYDFYILGSNPVNMIATLA